MLLRLGTCCAVYFWLCGGWSFAAGGDKSASDSANSAIDSKSQAEAKPTFDKATPAADNKPAELEVVIDVSEVPQHAEWADKAAKLTKEWYPKLVAALPSDGYKPPTKITMQFKKDMQGVAHTINDRIVIASDWITKHPEDIGMVHHELVHVVQQYRKPNRGAGWLVEGIADYLRWYVYEPTAMKPDELRRAQYADPNKAKFNDSYRTTASFLNYVVKNIDQDVVAKLNVLLREGKYSDKEFEALTKKPLSEVEADWKGSLRKK